MLSQLASDDLADLRADGLNPTDADVVRLNALALQISDGPETTAYSMPRFAVAGGVVFWEPTVAAFKWYDFAKTFADGETMEDWMFAFACANGRRRGAFDALYDPAAIERAMGEFLGGLSCTHAEVERAIYHVTVGADNEKPEKTPLAKARDADLTPTERERRNYAAMEDTLSKAAVATGFTYEDLMLHTPSRLVGYIYAAHVEAGDKLTQTSAAAHASYLATLHAIQDRLRAERDATAHSDNLTQRPEAARKTE